MNKTECIVSPGQRFDSPESILLCDFLSRKEKEKALMNWKLTCKELQDATNEGMPGGKGDEMSSVLDAILKLKMIPH